MKVRDAHLRITNAAPAPSHSPGSRARLQRERACRSAAASGASKCPRTYRGQTVGDLLRGEFAHAGDVLLEAYRLLRVDCALLEEPVDQTHRPNVHGSGPLDERAKNIFLLGSHEAAAAQDSPLALVERRVEVKLIQKVRQPRVLRDSGDV